MTHYQSCAATWYNVHRKTSIVLASPLGQIILLKPPAQAIGIIVYSKCVILHKSITIANTNGTANKETLLAQAELFGLRHNL